MRLAALCLIAGCSYKPSSAMLDSDQPVDDTPPIDAPPDILLSDAPCNFSTQFDTCPFAPTLDLTTDNAVYNTDTHVLSKPDGTMAVTLDDTQQVDLQGKSGVINVLLVKKLTIPGTKTLRVIGSKPFGVLSIGNITIDGTLDASSTRATNSTQVNGAGSFGGEAVECATSTPFDAADHAGGAAGGGGGGFRGAGGFGQDSDSDNGGGTGVPGGLAVAIPPGPRGGCPGGKGGPNGAGGAVLSGGGRGGGALYLLAAGMIEVKNGGVITAGGAGGSGGNTTDGGGAGGGSGGMILLEAGLVKIAGVVTANGGGGGGGSGNSKGGNGGNGQASVLLAANGGTPGNLAGPGETGSVGATLAGSDNTNLRPFTGGGGGGGGAGVISIKSTAPVELTGPGEKFSPPLVDLPN